MIYFSGFGFLPDANFFWPGTRYRSTHMKAISMYAFCIDSRPNSKKSVEWFVQNHLLGGLVNSNNRKLCNARYVVIHNEVFVVAIKTIKNLTRKAKKFLCITKFGRYQMRINDLLSA